MNIQTDFGRMSLALFVQSLSVLSSALASLPSGNMSRKVLAEFMLTVFLLFCICMYMRIILILQ